MAATLHCSSRSVYRKGMRTSRSRIPNQSNKLYMSLKYFLRSLHQKQVKEIPNVTLKKYIFTAVLFCPKRSTTFFSCFFFYFMTKTNFTTSFSTPEKKQTKKFQTMFYIFNGWFDDIFTTVFVICMNEMAIRSFSFHNKLALVVFINCF